jgi:hypothetical protein
MTTEKRYQVRGPLGPRGGGWDNLRWAVVDTHRNDAHVSRRHLKADATDDAREFNSDAEQANARGTR